MGVVFGMTGGFLLLLVLSVPVGLAIGVAALGALYAMGIDWRLVPGRLYNGVDSFTLLAVPMYIVAGGLMVKIGIADKLINFALAIVGHRRGGLGNTAVLSAVMFSGISGSTSAATAALGSILIPSLAKRGYSREQATAMLSGAGAASILVPPSMSMIVFGGLTGTSVSALFAAGLLPALIISIVVMFQVRRHAIRTNVAVLERASWRERVKALLEGGPCLVLPLIVFGGIFSGTFTATEAGVVAVLYALALGLFFYRTLTIASLIEALQSTVTIVGVVVLLMTTSSIFSWIMTVNQVPRMLVDAMGTVEMTQFLFLFLIIAIFVFLGMIMDELAIMIMIVPIAMPLALALGINPIHFGIVIVGCIGIGLFSPPVASALLVACSVGRVKMENVAWPLAPYLLIIFVMIVILASMPDVSLLLPRALGLAS